MHRLIVAVSLFSLPLAASADRITQMTHADRCAYSARLQVIAAHYYKTGKAREDVKIHWHGDETPYEIDFVTRTLDEGYRMIEREYEAGRADTPLEILGDRIFEACMTAKSL